VLALFGIVAEGFFGFNVLLDYALWGLPLLLLRRVSTRAILTIAAVAMATGPLLSLGAAHGWWPPVTSDASRAHEHVLAAAIETAGRHGSFVELAAARLTAMRFHYSRMATFIPDSTLTLFLLGLLAVRHCMVDEPRAHVRQIVGWMIFGAASWAAWWLVMYPYSDVPAVALASRVLFALGVVRDQWLCLTFMGAVALLLAYRPAWTERLAPFGWAGRMALTNYMIQVAALDFLVSGYGLSLRLRPAAGIVAAAVMFGVEAAFSRAWLGRYRFGPLEWAWRSVTYGRVPRLRRADGE
jgi:uncharacterized protein